jgi:hypothetical protein
MIRIFFIVVMGLALTGCGPKYKLVKQRQAPLNSQMVSACMQECRIQNNSCTNNCSSELKDCLNEQKQKAVADWPGKLELHNSQMQTYYAEKSLYDQHEANVNARRSSLMNTFNTYKYKCQNAVFNRASYCGKAEAARLQLLSALTDNAQEPKKPKKLSLQKLTSEYQQVCSRDCGCEQSFDTCFESCGGTIQTKRICVSGCE